MNDPTNPMPVPEATMPQSAPTPTAAPSPVETAPRVPQPGATATVATGANYDPAAVAGLPTPTQIGSTDRRLPSSADFGVAAGRYTPLRELARGGMGQVSVARDTELDRDIALKEIQPRFKVDTAMLHRFMLEARVTGRLEHPGIVPVYGLGNYPDGRPYYAMRFITGKSFQEMIDDFHLRESPNRDPQERSLALRAMLRRFGDVCNTIGFAHSRGYLHRDIKPSNVMVGAYGETLVVDWGLAKEMKGGRALPDDPHATKEFKPVTAAEFQETQEGYTLYGQTMGTPAFMSPEQAAGKWDVTGVASDVYSLGAMLYAILSGAPPYSGPSFEVITKVQRGEFKPVKLVKGNTPAPLDAIVRKAMAFDIADRYANALELGADVERWLADEPVSCYREPFTVRAVRWARRHRTAVIAASVLLLTATLALTVGLFVVNAEKKRTELARQEAVESRGEAREALLTITDDAVGEILAGSQKLSRQQIGFLNGLIDMYTRFTRRDPDSAESRQFIAGAWYRLGRLQTRVQQYDAALAAYRTALEKLDDPVIATTAEATRTRGEVRLYSGIAFVQQSRFADAEPELRAAMAIFEDLLKSETQPRLQFLLAQCTDRLGLVCQYTQRQPEAKDLYRKSLELREALARSSPDNPDYQFRVAQSCRQLAGVAFATGQRDEGIALARKAREIQEKLVSSHKTNVAYLALFADIDTLLTAQFTAPRRVLPKLTSSDPVKDSLAVVHARNAARTWGTLANLNPGDSLFRHRQAEANINLARQCQDNNQPREGLSSLNAALLILDELLQDKPQNPYPLEKTRVQALAARVPLLRELQDKSASAAADAAVAAAQALAANPAAAADARTYAANALIERALVKLGTQKYAEAQADLDAAWPYVQTDAVTDASSLLQWLRTSADWLDATDDFKNANGIGRRIADLKLPAGRSLYEAACFHGRVARLALVNENAPDGYALDQLALSVNFIREALKAGFTDIVLIDNEPDLSEARRTPQLQELLEPLRKNASRKDN